MSDENRERRMQELAKLLDVTLEDIYGTKMGFILNVSPFDKAVSCSGYICNTDKESTTGWMREIIFGLEGAKQTEEKSQ